MLVVEEFLLRLIKKISKVYKLNCARSADNAKDFLFVSPEGFRLDKNQRLNNIKSRENFQGMEIYFFKFKNILKK